jgi:hypothetical protein
MEEHFKTPQLKHGPAKMKTSRLLRMLSWPDARLTVKLN